MADQTNPSTRTDKCGDPFPDVCTPQTVRTPICYSTQALQGQGVTCGIPGFKLIAVQADCSGDLVEIQDANGSPVPGAFEVPCPSTIGPGGF
jgi:hypothetical protein